ncbi:hypothetical protein B4U79_17182, partial [Dinothrombium tinctorium]
ENDSTIPYSRESGLMPTRVLGDVHMKDASKNVEEDVVSAIPETSKVENARYAILASDGITDSIDTRRMCEIVKQDEYIIESVEKIFDESTRKSDFRDNQTIIGVKCSSY